MSQSWSFNRSVTGDEVLVWLFMYFLSFRSLIECDVVIPETYWEWKFESAQGLWSPLQYWLGRPRYCFTPETPFSAFLPWSGRRKMCVWEEPVTPSRAPVGSTSLSSITCQYQRLEVKPLKSFKVQEVTAPTAFPAASLLSLRWLPLGRGCCPTRLWSWAPLEGV